MARPTRKSAILSMSTTLAVIAMLIFVAPVQAVQLNMSADSDSAERGETLGFDLGLDIETGERVPFESITFELQGPTPVTCVFALDGTPISGCEDMTIFQTSNTADYDLGYGYGYGYDGTSTYGTSFGYGYGYGYGAAAGNELFWRVLWNTTGAAPGNYTATYFATAEGRTFNLATPEDITITTDDGRSVDLYVKEWYPKNNHYVFVCEASGFTPDAYDWNYGDGTGINDIPNGDTYHIYENGGTYTVYCGASDGIGTEEATLEVTVAQPPSVDIQIQQHSATDYTLTCEPTGMNPQTYDWEIRHLASGDVEYLQYDIADQDIHHTFKQSGEYFISCAATASGTTVFDGAQLEVSQPSENGNTDGQVTVLMNSSSATVSVPADADRDIRISVPQGVDNINVDLTNLLVNSTTETTAFLPVTIIFDVNTTSGMVQVTLPAGMSIFGSPSWDGRVTLPMLSTLSAPLPPGATANIVVDIGSNEPLTFDKAARISFAGNAGDEAAFSHGGTLTEINTVCLADEQMTNDQELVPGEDCKIDVAGDLSIWTKHFTQFVAYTTAPASTGSSGGNNNGGGGSGGFYARWNAQVPADEDTTTQTPAEEPIEAVNADAPVVERLVPSGETQAAEDAPGITGFVAGEPTQRDSIPGWMKFLGIAGITMIAAAGLISRFRKK